MSEPANRKPGAAARLRCSAMPAAPTIDVEIFDRPVEMVDADPFPAEAGAECVFLGRTRGETHPTHGALRRLSYEAYRPLAERTLSDLAASGDRVPVGAGNGATSATSVAGGAQALSRVARTAAQAPSRVERFMCFLPG